MKSAPRSRDRLNLGKQLPAPGRSVYGLQVLGLDEVSELLPTTQGDPDGPVVRIEQRDAPPPGPHPLDGDRVVRTLADGRHIALDRRSGSAVFYGPRLDPSLLAHPYLAPIATTFNRWAGREAFHAGAFVAGGSGWIVVGRRTAGKSTFLGALAGRGIPILADDVVITDGGLVFPGPRSVDLREAIPGLGVSRRQARLDTRWRVALPPSAPQVPVGGWIFLHWEDQLDVRAVGPAELLSRVAACRSLPALASDPTMLLNLAGVPAWDLGRPRDWAQLERTIEVVLATVAASAIPASGGAAGNGRKGR